MKSSNNLFSQNNQDNIYPEQDLSVRWNIAKELMNIGFSYGGYK